MKLQYLLFPALLCPPSLVSSLDWLHRPGATPSCGSSLRGNIDIGSAIPDDDDCPTNEGAAALKRDLG